MTKFDSEKFQEEVLNDFEFLKTWKKHQSSTFEERIADLGEKRGCLSVLFFKGLDKLETKATQSFEEQRNFIKWEKEAERLLAIPVIREALCSTLKDFVKKEILNDERLVNLVVETLEDDAYKKTFAIHSESILFAFICHKLSQTGIEKYCNQQ